MRAEGPDHRIPPVEHNQRAVAVRVERHLVGEGVTLALALEAAERDRSRMQFPEERVDKGGRAAEKLMLRNTWVANDAHGMPQAMCSPRAVSISFASRRSPLFSRPRILAMISLASSFLKFLMKPSKKCSP